MLGLTPVLPQSVSAGWRALRSLRWRPPASFDTYTFLRVPTESVLSTRVRAEGEAVSEPPVEFPGAQRPDRQRTVDTSGVQIAVCEWGDLEAPPVLLVHGGFDFAGTFDVFAPLLVRGGHRVVAFDQRGHGDSEHAALYSWDADVRDTLAVLDSIGPGPVAAVAHSKGGGIMSNLVEALPHRFTGFVNIDGMPTPHQHKDVAEHERTRLHARDLAGWLDHRAAAVDKSRRPGTLEELASRRRRMNPRLSMAWLRYLVSVGARCDADGWRWKIDPSLRFGGFGPWRASWALERMPSMAVPMLGIVGLVHEEMGWGTTPETIEPYLPAGARIEYFEDSGHFVHIEKPEEVAALVLEFLS